MYPASAEIQIGHGYWDGVATRTEEGPRIAAWRAYMRGVYLRLVREWLPGTGPAFKTDLFEEAVSDSPVLPELGPGTIGLDCSPSVVESARRRLGAPGVLVGDLRALPLATGSVERILSGSSLDHFEDAADIEVALRELARVLRPGGTMVITFDNPHNPIVRLRNGLPFGWLQRMRLVPYYVGATCGRKEARRLLEHVGLTVVEETAVVHVPRAPAIWAVTIAERLGLQKQLDLARLFHLFEVMERLPSRFLTGYYLAFRVERPPRGNGAAAEGESPSAAE